MKTFGGGPKCPAEVTVRMQKPGHRLFLRPGDWLALILFSSKTGFCDHRPSGNASLPDCFFFDRFAIGLRWAAAQTCLRDFIPQTPFFASRGFQPLDINSIISQSR